MNLPDAGGRDTKGAEDGNSRNKTAARKRGWPNVVLFVLLAAVNIYMYAVGPAPWLPWHYSFVRPGFDYVASAPQAGYALYFDPASVRAADGLVALTLGVRYSEPKDGVKYVTYDARLSIADKRMVALSSGRLIPETKTETPGPGFPWRDIAEETPEYKLHEAVSVLCAEKGIEAALR